MGLNLFTVLRRHACKCEWKEKKKGRMIVEKVIKWHTLEERKREERERESNESVCVKLFVNSFLGCFEFLASWLESFIVAVHEVLRCEKLRWNNRMRKRETEREIESGAGGGIVNAEANLERVVWARCEKRAFN